MTEEELTAIRDLTAAMKALAAALTPKMGGLGQSPLFNVRCECHCTGRHPGHYYHNPYQGGMG